MNDSLSYIKKLLKDWLESAEFVEECETVTAEYREKIDPDIVIVPPQIVYDYERAKSPPERFPAAEIYGISSNPQGEASAQDYLHEVSILWTVLGENEPVVVRQAEGLVLVTRRLTFRKTLPMDGAQVQMIPGGEDYGLLVQTRRNQLPPLVKGATIRLRVPTIV